MRRLLALLLLAVPLHDLLTGDGLLRYLDKTFPFRFLGWEFLPGPSLPVLYGIQGALLLAALALLVGRWQKIAAALYFLLFNYLQLLDSSNFINHYYLLGLLCFLLFCWPAQAKELVPLLWIRSLRLQLGIVYVFAGWAKLQEADWMLRGMPLRIWLPQQAELPLLGPLLTLPELALWGSWAAAFYDLTIPFWLSWRKSRPFALVAVFVFHGLTGLLFDIGFFPFIMIIGSLAFLPSAWHERVQKRYFPQALEMGKAPAVPALWRYALGGYFLIQFLLPLRHQLYGGHVLWHEAGYRFSWRVMLVEKEGLATFYIKESGSQRKERVRNEQHLEAFQEKRMATQPVHIWQYAQYLEKHYQNKGWQAPQVYADVFVSLNGRPSARLVDAKVDLAAVDWEWGRQDWVLEGVVQTQTNPQNSLND